MKNILDCELSKLIGNTDYKVPGLGIIAFKDCEEVYSNFFGLRNIDKKFPVTRDTKLRAASISKMFTIFTIMQLVAEGKINLDDDVNNYFDFNLRNPNFPNEPITIRMLASHTSTLRDKKIYSLPPNHSIKELINFAKEDKNYFKYCNLNYGILATIIERVTNERFDLYQTNHLFKQLNLNCDYVVGNLDKKSFDNLGTIYQKNSAQIDDYSSQPKKDFVLIQNPDARNFDLEYDLKDYKIGTNATIFSPQGGLRISFDELSNVMKMIFNHGKFNGQQIIQKNLLHEMIKSQWTFNENLNNGDTYGVMFNYGLGLYQIDGKSKSRLCKDFEINLIGHSGEAYGLISGFYFAQNFQDGIIFMSNGQAVDIDDKKSFGTFSNNYIWEEKIMNPILKNVFAKKF